MRNTLHESEAGRLTFPQVIAALTGAGVESYFADSWIVYSKAIGFGENYRVCRRIVVPT